MHSIYYLKLTGMKLFAEFASLLLLQSSFTDVYRVLVHQHINLLTFSVCRTINEC